MSPTSTSLHLRLLYGDQYETPPGVYNALLPPGAVEPESWLKGIAEHWMRSYSELMPLRVVLVTQAQTVHAMLDAGAGPERLLGHAQDLISLIQDSDDPISTAHVLGESYYMSVDSPNASELKSITYAAHQGMVEQWGDPCVTLSTFTADADGNLLMYITLRNVDDEQRLFTGEWQAVDVMQQGVANRPILHGFKSG